jgi:hypothetical protein
MFDIFKRKNQLLSVMLIYIVSLSCFNPFFPPTGNPPVNSNKSVNTLRSAPAGVLRQLNDAYQKKDKDLYKDLFSVQQDFRYYVLPGFSSSNFITTCERIDTVLCPYIASKNLTCLNYWTYTEEMKSNAHLFDEAEQITLICSGIDPSDIRYIVKENRETTNVEVILRGGALTIEGKTYFDNQGNALQDYYEVADIGQQVFYLEKDPQNSSLWVIQKWFDLNSIQ